MTPKIIAVTDASVFIACHRLGCLDLFFSLPFSVHTTKRVLMECRSLRAELDTHMTTGRLTAAAQEEYEKVEIKDVPAGLSPPDVSLIQYYAILDSEAIILTNDKAIRKKCKKLDYNFHGLLWVFDEFVREGFTDNLGVADMAEQWLTVNPWAPKREIEKFCRERRGEG